MLGGERTRSEIKRCIDDWARGGLALDERGVSEKFCQGGRQEAVVLPCLLGESKETEEDESGKDGNPPFELEGENLIRVQQDPRELENVGVTLVGVVPRNPWADTVPRGARGDIPACYRDGEKVINGASAKPSGCCGTE